MAYREKINEAVRKWLETYQRPPELEIPPKYDVKGLARAVKGERPTKRKNSPQVYFCLLYTSPSPRDAHESRMPSSA